MILIILVAGICLAYANGANDNFKGVATLFGSGTTDFRGALAWATLTTFAGSVAAFFLANGLVKSFSGKGLVGDQIAGQPEFAAAVAWGAALTVLIATKVGLPVSTTHSLVGALIGTGLVTSAEISVGNLGSKFLLPLCVSPILAIACTSFSYPVLRHLRQRLGVTQDICLCVGRETVEIVPIEHSSTALQRAEELSVSVNDSVTCRQRYRGQVLGISAGELMDGSHFLSAGIVSFVRGLNDTPKIAATLLVAPALGLSQSLAFVGIAIAVGGVLSIRRVADTMSQRITTMNAGQGLTANVVTGLIVIGASRWGVPVSTTHVSCGALFGIGAVTGQGRQATIITVLLAWLCTLPLAAGCAAVAYSLLPIG